MKFPFGPNPRRADTGIAILRIVTGIVFLMHGWQKVFTMGFGGVTDGFTHMGIPMPGVTSPLIALIELLGGAALIIGLLTRLASLGLMADMIGAIAFVHMKNGFFSPKGYEYPLLLLSAAVLLFLAGPGSHALDNNLAARRSDAASA